MAKKEDGIAQKGKTRFSGAKIDGPSIGDDSFWAAREGKTRSSGAKIDGPSIGDESGGKKSIGRSQETTKAVGRGLAKLAFQKGGK